MFLFRTEHHHFIHDPVTETLCNRIIQMLLAQQSQLERIEKFMSIERDSLAQILADVTAQKTVADSVKALLETQKKQLDLLIANSTNGQVTVADLQNLREHLLENTTELTDAVLANTEAPVPVPTETPDPAVPAPVAVPDPVAANAATSGSTSGGTPA